MRIERFRTSRAGLLLVHALLCLALSAPASGGPLGEFGNHDLVSVGIDPGFTHLPRTLADANGDGRGDYCRFLSEVRGTYLSCALVGDDGRFGDREFRSDPGFDTGYPGLPRAFADVNGDGRADYCRFVGNVPGVFLSCALAAADGRFGSYDFNSSPDLMFGYGSLPRTFADVNGDGRADYCRFVQGQRGRFLSCALATADGGFGNLDVNSDPGLAAGHARLPRALVDANSDGRADYCRFVGTGSDMFLSCILATAGGRFGPYVIRSVSVGAGFDLGLSSFPKGLGDVTGDGRVDYCRFVGSAAVPRLSCAAANGNGGFGGHDVTSALAVAGGTTAISLGLPGLPRMLGDVNADGRADFCRFVPGATLGTLISCALVHPPGRPAGIPDFSGPLFSAKISTASGVRRVVAILWDPGRPNHPAPPVETIDDLLFGADPSVRDWYRQNAGSRFRLVREAVLGWYPADRPAGHYWSPTDDDPNDAWIHGHVEKWAEAVRKADVEFDFGVHDANGDGTLDPQELTVLIVIPQAGPFGTVRAPAGREVPTVEPLVVDGVRIPLIAEWYTGIPANLGAPAHELSHLLLGTPDLYMNGRPWPFAAHGFSIMDSSYGTTHFDPFVKLKTGWLSTRVVTGGGTFVLRDVETRREAIILYDPVRGPREYFLLENRWRGATYDRGRSGAGGGLPNSGLAIWHIIEDPALLPLSNPPIGGPGEWGRRGIRLVRANGGVPEDDAQALFRTAGVTVGDDTSPAHLRWIDGSPSGFTVTLLSGPAPAVTVSISR